MKLLIFILICVFAYITFKKQKHINIIEHHVPLIEQKIVGYKTKYRIMNESEKTLFFELKKQLPQDYFIFPNMRIADVIEATNGSGYYNRLNKILPKHLDFVVCNPQFKPVFAIELNGRSHQRQDRIDKDKEKKKIVDEAQLPFFVIEVETSFENKVKEIKGLMGLETLG